VGDGSYNFTYIAILLYSVPYEQKQPVDLVVRRAASICSYFVEAGILCVPIMEKFWKAGGKQVPRAVSRDGHEATILTSNETMQPKKGQISGNSASSRLIHT
jgi:hypothetical protein